MFPSHIAVATHNSTAIYLPGTRCLRWPRTRRFGALTLNWIPRIWALASFLAPSGCGTGMQRLGSMQNLSSRPSLVRSGSCGHCGPRPSSGRFQAHGQQRRARQRGTHCRAHFDEKWTSTVDTQTVPKRAALLEYANTVEPSLIDSFSEQAPATVVDAIRTTVRGALGTLPPQYFDVAISSRADAFAQLLYSNMMAGVMLRNALFRMELRGALVLTALPAGAAATDGDVAQHPEVQPEQLDLWAPGSQLTQVSGDVLRWHMEHGTQTVPAAQYIQDLEAEIRSLKQQVASVRVGSSNQNELLEYVQSLGADAELLTKNASHDVLDAMTAFIDRCMGSNEHTDLAAITEYNIQELAPQLFWTTATGYMLRSLEVRYDIQSSLDDVDTPGLLP